MRKAGFTLVELLIYIAVFAVLAVTFSGILITFTRVNVSQVAKNEVAAQLNFILQSIQRTVSNASLVVVRSSLDGLDDAAGEWDEEDSVLGETAKYLVVKNRDEGGGPNDANSPVAIYEDNGDIIVRRGRGTLQQTTTLNTNKVVVDKLDFVKFVSRPGRDVVEIDLTLSAADQTQDQVSRKLLLGVGKAFAAVFDTDLLPGSDGAADIGLGTARWRNANFSGDVRVGSLTVGPGTKANEINFGAVSINPPSIAAGGQATFSVSLATEGQIFLTPPENLDAGLIFVGARYDTPNSEIDLTIRNTGASAVDGSARLWNYFQIR